MGRVVPTNVNPGRIEKIRERVRNAGFKNVTFLTATPTDSGLPPDPRDAAYI